MYKVSKVLILWMLTWKQVWLNLLGLLKKRHKQDCNMHTVIEVKQKFKSESLGAHFWIVQQGVWTSEQLISAIQYSNWCVVNQHWNLRWKVMQKLVSWWHRTKQWTMDSQQHLNIPERTMQPPRRFWRFATPTAAFSLPSVVLGSKLQSELGSTGLRISI